MLAEMTHQNFPNLSIPYFRISLSIDKDLPSSDEENAVDKDL